jgi:hypothetical protein
LKLTAEGGAAAARLIGHIQRQIGHKLEEGVIWALIEFAVQVEISDDDSSEIWKFSIERSKSGPYDEKV